jgi:hypothetical protein
MRSTAWKVDRETRVGSTQRLSLVLSRLTIQRPDSEAVLDDRQDSRHRLYGVAQVESLKCSSMALPGAHWSE